MRIKLLAALLLTSIFLFAQDDCIPERPDQLVSDYTGSTLNRNELSSLEQKLRAYNDTTSTQITVVIMPDICGDEIKFFTAQLGEKWGVGQQGADNGCVLLMSMEAGNRQIAIQNGYGLEEYLTDAMSRRIIEQIILPEFKQGDYYGGLDQGTTAIMQLLAGQFEGNGGGSSKPKLPIFGILLFIIILFSIIGRNRRGGPGSRGGGGYWIGGFGGGHIGGGGGFSGGGGFGGFGGGSFGGGGASGSW